MSSEATRPRMRSRNGLDDLLPLLERPRLDAENGPAVVLGDDDVLGHVHQAAGQVAGVGGLERGVGQTLAGAVGGDEVLQHGQPFLEVPDDRALDDLADAAGDLLLRLGHETAHAGQLADLLLGAARARVGHHEDRVETVPVLGAGRRR